MALSQYKVLITGGGEWDWYTNRVGEAFNVYKDPHTADYILQSDYDDDRLMAVRSIAPHDCDMLHTYKEAT